MFPSLSVSHHFTFDFRLHQFSKTNLTQASLRYTSDQRETSFEIQILPTLKFILHIPISLLSLKNWEAVTRILLTVCVSLCATRKYPHVNILRWFAKSFVLPLALSFSPDIDTICHTQRLKSTRPTVVGKNWYEFNSINLNCSISILNQIPQVESCPSNRLSRTRASGPKTHFLQVNKWVDLYEF